MTISTEDREAGPYVADGVDTTFEFSFKVFTEADVLVVYVPTGGAEQVLVMNTNYTVVLNADQDVNPGGVVTTVGASSPYAAGTITISSDIAETQGTGLPSGGNWNPKVIERALDKLTILVQQLRGLLDRSLTQPLSDAVRVGDIPTKANRASKVLAFDANGEPIAQANVPTSGVAATAYMETLLDDANAATARQTLLLDKKAADVPAAATLDLSATTGDLVDVTGNTGITAIALGEGVEKTLRFTGTPLITHGASLVCPGNVNIQAAAGDTCKVRGYAGGVVRVFGYQAFEQGVLSKLATTKGDVLVATAARTMARKAAPANGFIRVADSGQADGWLDQVGGMQFGQCRLTKSGADLLLSRFNGRALFINGTWESIPAAGVTLAPPAVASTTYYIYAFMNAGVMTLEQSTTAPAADATYGHQIKTADATRTLVGMARTTAANAWADTDAQRFALSYFNRRGLGGKSHFTANRSTTSTSDVEINSEIRCEFLTWADEAVHASADGQVQHDTTGGSWFAGLAFDGAVGEAAFNKHQHYTATSDASMSMNLIKTGLAEGYHYATVIGAVASGTGTWFGGATVNRRCSLRVGVSG